MKASTRTRDVMLCNHIELMSQLVHPTLRTDAKGLQSTYKLQHTQHLRFQWAQNLLNCTFFHASQGFYLFYLKYLWTGLQLFPPEEWLVGASLPSKYAPHTINKILDELSPERVRILCQSKKFEGSTDCAEPWYNTLYSVENVTPQMIQVCQLTPTNPRTSTLISCSKNCFISHLMPLFASNGSKKLLLRCSISQSLTFSFQRIYL
jgi:secreted Zn-dependent insulinase-like peptidase